MEIVCWNDENQLKQSAGVGRIRAVVSWSRVDRRRNLHTYIYRHMGAPKQKWTSEEEGALRAGVEKYGAGKWRTIQKDPEFGRCLAARSNVDLKDKWRNMSVSAGGQGSRDKVKTPRVKAIASLPYSSVTAESTTVFSIEATPSTTPDNLISPKSSSNGKNHSPRYDGMILEALTIMQDPNGIDIATIASFMEERHELPTNFKRMLGPKLRRLVAREKVMKIHNSYKLKDMPSTTEVISEVLGSPIPMDNSMQYSSAFSNTMDTFSVDRINEASMAAAMKVADAEAMSAMADKAAEESELAAILADESDMLFEAASVVFEQLLQDGVLVLS